MNRRDPYFINLLKGQDYGLATVFGIPAGIYISGYTAFKRMDSGGKWIWVKLEQAINWLFCDPFHCVNSMKKTSQDIKECYGVDV